MFSSTIEVKDFDLKHTLECGQFFRYRRISPSQGCDVSANLKVRHVGVSKSGSQTIRGGANEQGEFAFGGRKSPSGYLAKIAKLDPRTGAAQEKSPTYLVQAKDRFAIIQQQGNTIHIDGTMCSRYAQSFFRLDDNFAKIKKSISHDPFVASAIKQYPGLRLLRQDPWECLISYVCSSASNIPKIQKNIELISQCFGEKMECEVRGSDNKFTYYAFPEIGAIDHCQSLKKCGVGYRDKFIHQINSTVDKNFFARLKKRNYEDARLMLMELPGVGPKVADCVCLFALDHLDSFPVDVWVKRIMTELYGKDIKKRHGAVNERNIRLFAKEQFGDYAGYAQQYLFHLRRSSKQV